MDLGFEIQKTNCWNKNQQPQGNMCTKFQAKQATLTFLAQIWPKMGLGSEIQKTDVRIRISIVKMLCMPFLRKNKQLWLFRPKFDQQWVLGSDFQKSKCRFGISILEILCAPIFRQNETYLDFWAQICPKIDFWVKISKI